MLGGVCASCRELAAADPREQAAGAPLTEQELGLADAWPVGELEDRGDEGAG